MLGPASAGGFTSGKDPVPTVGGTYAQSGRVREISLPPGFDPGIVQPDEFYIHGLKTTELGRNMLPR